MYILRTDDRRSANTGPIHYAFGYTRLGFSGSADPIPLFRVLLGATGSSLIYQFLV